MTTETTAHSIFVLDFGDNNINNGNKDETAYSLNSFGDKKSRHHRYLVEIQKKHSNHTLNKKIILPQRIKEQIS